MLFWWPMGVRKAQEAPTATAMRKGSGLTPMRAAMPAATGAATTAVAALFMTSERVIVSTSKSASSTTGETSPPRARSASAMSAVPPVSSSALPTGIMAPKSTITDQSTLS